MILSIPNMQGRKLIFTLLVNGKVILLTILQKLTFCLYMTYNVQYTLQGMSHGKLHVMKVKQYLCNNVQ